MKPRSCANTSTSLLGGTANTTLNFRGRYVLPVEGLLVLVGSPPATSVSSTQSSWYALVRGRRRSATALAIQSVSAWSPERCGLGLHITLRFTSPHAASVSRSARFTSRIAARRLLLMTPWSWKHWRFVILRVPFPRASEIASIASHWAGVQTPPGTRTLAMKM